MRVYYCKVVCYYENDLSLNDIFQLFLLHFVYKNLFGKPVRCEFRQRRFYIIIPRNLDNCCCRVFEKSTFLFIFYIIV